MDLDTIVGEIGVTVETGDLPDGWWGAYSHEYHRIILRPGLGWIQGRSVLMHELGHAYFRHTRSGSFEEREASQWAARRLIPTEAFVSACQVAETAQTIAHILSVLPRDVTHYVNSLTEDERIRIHRKITGEAA